jgi:basic membrane protein A
LTQPHDSVTIVTNMSRGYVRAGLLSALAALVIGAAVISGADGAAKLRVALVLDYSYVNDPFQRGAYLGLAKAMRELGVEGKVAVQNPSAGDATPTFTYLARQRYDLIIGLGFFQAPALDAVALRFPRQKFAILDESIDDLQGRPRNVEGTHFRTEEGGYLAGYLASLLQRSRRGPHVVGSVGGVPLPQVNEFIAGYQAGAKAGDPRVRTLNGYSNDFNQAAKCRTIALAQIAAGASAVFQVADACGLGALAAAKERHVWGIGVDVDESYLGPHVLTSVVKRLDIAVYEVVKSFQARRFHGGRNAEFDLANGGVALGKISPRVPQRYLPLLGHVRAAIVSGKIKVPSRLAG